ncbi:MAG: glycosyltransferase family 2 protein [Arcticibacter sp.]
MTLNRNPAATPLISIIVVTLNAESCLRNCLQSIIEQQDQNIELLIFDGLSTDSTVDIIKEYQEHITYWESAADKGIYDAMNKAVKISRGDYLYFLGADDQLLPGFSQMRAKLDSQFCIYYGDMSYDGEATSRKKYSAYRLSKESICHQAIIYSRTVFEYYDYNLRYPLAADWVLNFQLWSDKRFKFKFFPLVIANFSMSGASSLKRDENFVKDHGLLIRRYLGYVVYVRYCIKKLRSRARIKKNKCRTEIS